MAIEENKKETVRAVSFANMPPRLREKALKDLEAQQLQEGKSPKDFAWEQFVINQMDFDIAEKLLTQYMSERRREGYNKDVLYKELFTAFSQGSGEVKKNSKFRDYMASVIATGDNINLMQEIAAYYEKNKLTKSIPSLYYKMYEIYFNGKGVNIDLDKAVKYLKLSVEGENTEEKRKKLREIYAKLSNESNEEKRLEFAYEKAVSEKIKSAGTDYANYLMEHNKKKKAVQYLVADEEYKLAYYAVNIESESSVNNGVKAFQDVPPANEFKKSLQLMKDRFGDLKRILHATKPASYTGILWRYILFNYLYIPYHTFRLNQMAFILAILAIILVPIGVGVASDLEKNTIYALVLMGVLLWGLVLFCVDLWRRYKFSRAEDLWKRLEYHIQLESRKEIFEAKAENEKLTVAKKVLTGIASLVGFIATLILGATIHQAVVNDWNLNDNISSAVVTSASDTKVTEEKKSDIDAKTAKDIKTTKTAKEENAPAKAKTVTMERSEKNTRKSQNLEQAKREIKGYGIDGNFISTSFGNSEDGFIAIDDVGDIVVVDRKNNRAGIVKPNISLKEFQNQKGRNEPYAMILDCTFFKEKKGRDAEAGYWSGSTHYMKIQAAYKIERDHSVVPGMLKTGAGKNPSSIKTVLYETRNIDFVNLFLIEAMNIELRE